MQEQNRNFEIQRANQRPALTRPVPTSHGQVLPGKYLGV